MIISSGGEVEVFSKNEKCNQKVLEFPSFGGQGHSVDLLDEQLILLGDSKFGEKGEYKSIHQPRKGLLAMTFSKEVSPLGKSPLWHTSHVYGNQLLAIGGESQSKSRFSNTVWKGLNLRWQNGTQFSRFASGACEVKVAKDVFLLIGGLEKLEESTVEMNTVLRLNITEEVVKELPPIKQRRAYHACEVNGENILIAGGTQGGITTADEVYNLTSQESTLLNVISSLGRHQHALQRIEDTIFALGGLRGNSSDTAAVEKFDWDDLAWKQHNHSLFSKHREQLSVTSFPLSAIDCHDGCRCGVAGTLGNTRIVGGSEAQVFNMSITISHNSCLQNLDQENAYPWIAALIMDEDSSSGYVNTKCSGTLVILSTCIY